MFFQNGFSLENIFRQTEIDNGVSCRQWSRVTKKFFPIKKILIGMINDHFKIISDCWFIILAEEDEFFLETKSDREPHVWGYRTMHPDDLFKAIH